MDDVKSVQMSSIEIESKIHYPADRELLWDYDLCGIKFITIYFPKVFYFLKSTILL